MYIDQFRRHNEKRIKWLMNYAMDERKLFGRRLRACILANELLFNPLDHEQTK